MKSLIILLFLFLSLSTFSKEIISINHSGHDYRFIYNDDGSLHLDFNQVFYGKIIFGKKYFYKKSCDSFKNLMEVFVNNRNPQEISREEFIQKRKLIINSMNPNYGAYEMVFLPFGINLTDRSLHKKIASKLGLSVDNQVFNRINHSIRFDQLQLNYHSSEAGTLSYYSDGVANEIIDLFSKDFSLSNSNLESFRKGVVPIKTYMYETTCDLLYYDTTISFKLSAQESERVVEKVQVKLDDLVNLHSTLQRISPTNNIDMTKRDSFLAGIEIGKALEMSKFVYPTRLIEVYGKESELNFYLSLFSDKKFWLPGDMSEERSKRLLSNTLYQKTAPGNKHNGEIEIDVESIEN